MKVKTTNALMKYLRDTHNISIGDSKDKRNLIAVIGAAIIILLGLYTIFSENVLFVALGIILIIYSILDIINYIRFAK